MTRPTGSLRLIGIKQSPSCFAAVGGMRTRWLWPALAWLGLTMAHAGAGACGNGQKQSSQETNTLVRPATSAPAKIEEAAEAPLPAERGELPRGVSPPQLSEEEASAQAQPEEGAEPTARPAKPASRPAQVAKAPAAEAAKAPATKLVQAPAAPKPQRPAPSTVARVERPKPAASSASAPARAQPRSTSAPQPAAANAAPVVTPPPAPVAQPVAAAPERVTVQVPSTDHVRVDVPAGLQGWLDADDRMRPWLGKAIAVADSCYAKLRADNPAAAGEIAVQITMHENARPSGRLASAAPAVSGITICATTRLLGVKMPLFTGREGETYTVRVRFSP
jgi:hypothetical protein